MIEVFLIIIVAILSVLLGFMPFLAYRKGIIDGQDISNGKQIKPIQMPKIKKDNPPQFDKKTKEMLDYIDNYKA